MDLETINNKAFNLFLTKKKKKKKKIFKIKKKKKKKHLIYF